MSQGPISSLSSGVFLKGSALIMYELEGRQSLGLIISEWPKVGLSSSLTVYGLTYH